MKPAKTRRQKQTQEKVGSVLSMNIGIAACITLILTVIKDIAILLSGENIRLNAILGALALISFLIILKMNLSEKIRNKKNLRCVIDVFTIVAVLFFGLENTVFVYQDNVWDKLSVLLIVAMLVGMLIYISIWTFCLKKDRKHNTD